MAGKEWGREGKVGLTGQEGEPSTQFSQMLKRSRDWNIVAILCAVFFKSSLELDGYSR